LGLSTAEGKMTTATAHSHAIAGSVEISAVRRWLLMCGIAGAALYPLADILASTRYPGFSYRDQAVSELFAIGAPTSTLVVTLFSISSTLLLLFAIGIWMSSNGRRLVKWVAAMMALNAVDALVLWNFFPMHMRGEEPGFTDTMHGLLAIDPFLLAAIVMAAVVFRGPFRFYTVATILFTTALAVMGFSYVTAVFTNQPTPWMGASERAAQYATNVLYAVFAVMLLRGQSSSESPSRLTTQAGLIRFGIRCGFLSALTYAAMLVFVPLAWPGYSSASQTVSELSAIGAPSRPLWVALGILWTMMYAAFGWGIWKAAGERRALRISGAAIFVGAVVGIFWPPMHLREVLATNGESLTDTLHVFWTAMNGVFTLTAMVFAAAAFGRRFRAYSIATVLVILVAGIMTSMNAAQLEANLPTPGMGAWERVNIGAWLLWVAVLSVLLSRRLQVATPASLSRAK